MKVKLIGVGKCGSRLCYDFFAQIRGLPSSYEIRVFGIEPGYKRVLREALTIIRVPQIAAELRKQFELLVGGQLLRDAATYALVDSDLENNEVTQQIVLLTAEGERSSVFPGVSHMLNNLTGGCQYHIISESEIYKWNDPPLDLLDPREAEVLAYAFSVGGGTGGGAGISLGYLSARKEAEKQTNKIVHRMGIAILPESDEDYDSSPDDISLAPASPMDVSEKYNMGRFFTSLLGRRQQVSGGQPALNGTWLISNDLLRTAGGAATTDNALVDSGSSQVLNDRGLSLINAYIGLALCTLLNASSTGTSSIVDLDPRELNSHLNGGYYISGFGYIKRDKSISEEGLVAHLGNLLFRTLCGTGVAEGQLYGLSVPVNREELQQLSSMVTNKADSINEYIALLGKYDPAVGPREFRTTRRVLVLMGQPQSTDNSTRLDTAIKEAMTKIFPSELVFYSFKHAGDLDYLLVLVTDPFMGVIANSVFDYVFKTWMGDDADGSELGPFLRDPSKPAADILKLMKAGPEEEHLPTSFMGEPIAQAAKGSEPSTFSADVVMLALTRMREILHWRRKLSPRF